MIQTRVFLTILFTAISSSAAFSTAFLGTRSTNAALCRPTLSMAVADISSEDAFDKAIKTAGGSLVVVDYSTTWCGPCKVIAPKFDALSDEYTNAVFLKVSSMYGITCDYIV